MSTAGRRGDRQSGPGPAEPAPSPAFGPQRPETPREVRIATALLSAVGSVLLVNAVIALLFRDRLRTAATGEIGSLVPADQIDAILIGSAIVLLIIGAVFVVTAMLVLRGRQWARVLAFVAGGTMILLTAVAALAGAGLLAVLLLGASVGIVALLMQSSVGPFFDAPDRPR